MGFATPNGMLGEAFRSFEGRLSDSKMVCPKYSLDAEHLLSIASVSPEKKHQTKSIASSVGPPNKFQHAYAQCSCDLRVQQKIFQSNFMRRFINNKRVSEKNCLVTRITTPIALNANF